MQVILFRHAERENTGIANPPLSRRGLSQAEALFQKIQNGDLPKPQRLLVSTQIRTQQTFARLSQEFSLEMTPSPELDERQSSESGSQFTNRVKRFLQFLERQSGSYYVCTHLDWIEEALVAIPSPEDLLAEKYQAWAPAQFIEFDLQEGLWLVLKSGRIS